MLILSKVLQDSQNKLAFLCRELQGRCSAVPGLPEHSQVCNGLCYGFWPVLFYEDMKMSFLVPCVITVFKMGNAPFCLGILRDWFSPLTFFPLSKETLPLGALLLLSDHSDMGSIWCSSFKSIEGSPNAISYIITDDLRDGALASNPSIFS